MSVALHRAVEQLLLTSNRAIVVSVDIDRIIRSMLRKGASADGEPLIIKRRFPTVRDISGVVTKLTESEILCADADLSDLAWKVVDKPDPEAAGVCCAVDPFCYVSHISAMERWGLTNRNPVALHLTRPRPSLWRIFADKEGEVYEREETDLLSENGSRPLPRELFYAARPLRRSYFTFPEKVRKRAVNTYGTAYPGASVAVPDTDIRLSTIGQTFADMLTEPALCGGVQHVLEIWDEHAAIYLEDIVEVVDKAPTKIIKVRAGYILDERLGLSHPCIENWLKTATQRGSSQKLDPARPYVPPYSEKWMLSLNA